MASIGVGFGKGHHDFDSMTAIQADGVAMCDAHPDLEVFRLRLGKAFELRIQRRFTNWLVPET